MTDIEVKRNKYGDLTVGGSLYLSDIDQLQEVIDRAQAAIEFLEAEKTQKDNEVRDLMNFLRMESGIGENWSIWDWRNIATAAFKYFKEKNNDL
jgi:hypothetical protein